MHGWIIINKPKGESSARIVSRVKRLTGAKVGHAGTLDPLATGVLPLALGEATKVVQFLIDSDKQYEFEVHWGEERTTDDAEGEVVQKSDKQPTDAEILEVMESFKGDIEQMPPSYSALKIDGQRAYDLARAGKDVSLKPRKVTIRKIVMCSDRYDGNSAFRIDCSKGTYVRSVARDMGRKLGCFGYVSLLHRTRHGKFNIDQAISLEKLEELCQKGAVASGILPLEEVLDGIPAFPLDENEELKIRHGIAIENRLNLSGEIIALLRNSKLVAVAKLHNNKLQPTRVFNH